MQQSHFLKKLEKNVILLKELVDIKQLKVRKGLFFHEWKRLRLALVMLYCDGGS